MQAPLSNIRSSRQPQHVAERLFQAQVAALYSLYPGAYRVSLLAALGYGLFYYWHRHDALIFGWLVLRLASLPVYVWLTSPGRDPRSGTGNAANWLRNYLWAFAYHGLTWSLVPWLFMPADDLLLTASTMLVIMVFCTGGIHGVTHCWPAVLAFMLPLTSSLILALAVRATDHLHLFLTFIAVLHSAMSLYTARRQHELLTQSLLDCFENQELSEQLQEKISLIQHISDEKTRFFAAASHDLRQPLHAISLFGAVLEKELQGHPQHIFTGQMPYVQRLVEAGAEVNFYGWPPLTYAAFNGHREIVEYLLKRGAEINAKTENGSTALFFAARNGHTAIVRLLLENDADPTIINENEETAVDAALKGKNTDSVELLRDVGGRSGKTLTLDLSK